MDDIIEFLVELILEIVFEGGEVVAKNKKTSKWIRYPLIFIFFSVIIVFFAFITALGISILFENVLGGIVILGLDLLFAGLFINHARKIYKEAKKEKDNLLAEYKEQEGISPDLK